MRQLFLLLAIMCFRSITVWAQINIAGIVTDEKEQPLAGVTLMIRNTNIGTTTQNDGRFTMQVNAELPLTLVVSSIGYRAPGSPGDGRTIFGLSLSN